MLTKGLDKETEKLLAEILEQEKTTSDELIKNLIRDRWMSLNQSAELVEESGGASREASQLTESQNPRIEQLSDVSANSTAVANGAKQKNNKQAIAEFIKKKRFC
jgi:hypothetical protein